MSRDEEEITDIPVEGPTKYGSDQFDDIDPDELANFLSGNGSSAGNRADPPE